jgi:hypothetical protein
VGRLDVEADGEIRVWQTSAPSPAEAEAGVPSVEAHLRSVLIVDRPDLVHFHDPSGPVLSLIPLVAESGLPSVVTVSEHGGGCERASAPHRGGSRLEPHESSAPDLEPGAGGWLPRRLRSDFVAWALSRASQLVASCPDFSTADRARIQVIPDGTHGDACADDDAMAALAGVYDAIAIETRPRHDDRPLILCGGDDPPAHVAELCDALSRLEEQYRQPLRLVWHARVHPRAWAEASLFWSWSPGIGGPASILRALRAGVPIVAPGSCPITAALEAGFGVAQTYRSVADGAVALVQLPHDAAALHALRWNCRRAAAVFAASAPPETYDLPTPAVQS